MAGVLIHTPYIAGVDEAGRGPLAGPVVAAAVVLQSEELARHMNDSKKLSAERRQFLEAEIKENSYWAVVFIDSTEVDRINILQASLLAMERALGRLHPAPSAALIDGNQTPKNSPVPCTTAVKGDATYAAIAAASILAKTARDRYMVALAEKYPRYGFERHFGYPTPEHMSAIREFGLCPEHRRSFAPVAKQHLQPCLALAD